jgi:type I restriction enzyme S subunit
MSSSQPWKLQPLESVAKINYGRSPADILSLDGPYPVVGTGGTDRRGDDFLYDGESVILGRKGTIDRVSFISGKFWAIDTAYYLSNFENVSPNWLYHFFQTLDFHGMNEATGVPSLSRSLLQKLAIPVPADTEQSKIAEILSAVDQAIEQTEALIAKQQRIKTGLMQDLLTRGIDEHGQLRTEATHAFKDSPLGRIPVEWEVAPIESKLREIIDYRGRTPVKTDAGIPLITAKNVREGYLSVHPQEFIADEGYETWMTRGIPAAGDVMLTTEAPMGNVARVPGYRIALAQRLITLPTIPEELSSDFLFWLLHWSQTLEKLTLLTSGSTVAGIKQSVFRRVLFSFPAISEQLRITKALDVDKSIADANLAQLTKLQSLKKALMQDLLTGHKRVTALLEPTVA